MGLKSKGLDKVWGLQQFLKKWGRSQIQEGMAFEDQRPWLPFNLVPQLLLSIK